MTFPKQRDCSRAYTPGTNFRFTIPVIRFAFKQLSTFSENSQPVGFVAPSKSSGSSRAHEGERGFCQRDLTNPIDRPRRTDVPVIDSSRREAGRDVGRGRVVEVRSRQSLLIYHLVAAGSSPAFSIQRERLLCSRGLAVVLPVNAIKSANGIAANGRSVIIQLRGTIYRYNSNLGKSTRLSTRKTDPNFHDKQQQQQEQQWQQRQQRRLFAQAPLPVHSGDHLLATSFKRKLIALLWRIFSSTRHKIRWLQTRSGKFSFVESHYRTWHRVHVFDLKRIYVLFNMRYK